MPEYSAREALLWQLIAKKQKEKTRITYSSENSVSETTATTPSCMLDRAFVSKQQWGSGLVAASNAMLVGLPTYGPLTARNGLKRLSGYLDLHLCFAFVT